MGSSLSCGSCCQPGLAQGPFLPELLRAAHEAVPLPSPTSSHQPCPCISRSLPAAPALQGLFPVPQPGSGAAQTSPAHGDAWLQPPGMSGVSLGRINTLTRTRNQLELVAQAEAIHQLPSSISSKPRAGPSAPGIIKGGEAGTQTGTGW